MPKVTVVLRKAYGGAYITMNSKDLGADLAFAWPDAEIGIMGAEARRSASSTGARSRAADDPEAERDRLAADYADEHLSAAVAAREGFVDELVEPADTRRRLAGRAGGAVAARARTATAQGTSRCDCLRRARATASPPGLEPGEPRWPDELPRELGPASATRTSPWWARRARTWSASSSARARARRRTW